MPPREALENVPGGLSMPKDTARVCPGKRQGRI